MKKILKEVLEELIKVFSGKSLDVLIPPILFLVVYRVLSLGWALSISVVVSVIFFSIRVYKKDNLTYAIGGLVGTLFAAFMSYINQNANNFFLPDIIGTSFLILVSVVSLFIGKPLAAYVSHITRGWTFEWFLREDIKPAYREVTIFWLIFFSLRLGVEIYLYLNSSVEELVFANIILGFPITILVLTISYIYGIWRLKKMGGPGIDEYDKKLDPPYRGQTRGF